MSAVARLLLVLAILGTFVLVKMWPQTSEKSEESLRQKRQNSQGNNRNIPRSQPFQSSHNSNQHGQSQARRDDFTTSLAYLDHIKNNQTYFDNQTVNTGPQRRSNSNLQLISTGPQFDSSSHVAAVQHSHSYQNMQNIDNLNLQNKNLENNVSSPSRKNTQSLSTATQNTDSHSVLRGNRRVMTSTARLRTQALSNLNENSDKSEENKFQTNFPVVNITGNIGTSRIQSNSEPVGLQNKNQPLQQPIRNTNNMREKFPVINNSQSRSSSNGNRLSASAIHGRIVTSTNKNEGKRPNMTGGIKQWETSTVSASGFRAKPSGGAIVFPDTKFVLPLDDGKEPKCAQGSTFCTEVDNYPTPRLSDVMKIYQNFAEFFRVESIPNDLDVRNRIGPLGNEMCDHEESIVFPKAAKNKDDKWMFIVNLDEQKYKQGIYIEKCKNEDKPCRFSEGVPNGYMTTCRQKFSERKLLAVDDDGKPIPDSFFIPSCCACYYSSVNGDISARQGNVSTTHG